MAKNIKQLTLLHSNDMHGDFFAEEVDESLIGGVSMLSGYLNKVRAEEKNVLYAIAGDLFRGSVIDSEFKGVSTIDIANALGPDVVSVGNHEVDYGLAHLLFLEKCARFPFVTANVYLKNNNVRLFKPYKIMHVDGMKIMFIGIVTEEVLNLVKKDPLLATLIDTADAAAEVKKIINAHASIDIDLTVLLTHIGYEEDVKLAKMLNPECGVDLIIGGHSHTLLEEPTVVNGIPIVQVGMGTDRIGRFDLNIDTDNNCIDSYTWSTIPITSENCPKDSQMEKILRRYKKVVDKKYSRVLSRFSGALTHPDRKRETALGNFFADATKQKTGVDISFVASGGIRSEQLGPIVTLEDLTACYPFSEELYMVNIDGKMLNRIFEHLLREQSEGAHTEFYQINKECRVVYSKSEKKVTSLTYCGREVKDEDIFKLSVVNYHFLNFTDFFGVKIEDTYKYGKPRIIASSDFEIVEEYLNENQRFATGVDGRITIAD